RAPRGARAERHLHAAPDHRARTREGLGEMNVGIIGCGLIGKKRADSLLDTKLVACADTALERAQALAGRFGARATANWREVAEADDIQIVVIATPHDALAEITLAAVRAGKHVLVE